MGFGVYSYIYIIYINIYPHLQPHLPYPKRQGRGDTTTTAPHNHHHDISIYYCFIFYLAYCAFLSSIFQNGVQANQCTATGSGAAIRESFYFITIILLFYPLPSIWYSDLLSRC